MNIVNSIARIRALVIALVVTTSLPVAWSAESTARPAPPASDGYRLSIRDTIEVTIFDEPDMTAVRTVDSNGQVVLHLLTKPVPVAGKTVREAEALVQTLYVEGKFLKHPTASIKIVQYAPREVEVTGEVNTQGMLTFPPERTSLDISEVIARCGGFTQSAKRSSIQVLHISDDGKEMTINVNYDDLRKPGRERVIIFPGDRIRVPAIVF